MTRSLITKLPRLYYIVATHPDGTREIVRVGLDDAVSRSYMKGFRAGCPTGWKCNRVPIDLARLTGDSLG